jgi:chromosome partitioning protein
MAKRISVINFKGGVGKTSLALHLGCYIARFISNSKVLLVDVDHQSSLSIVCLDPGRWEERCEAGLTVDRIFSSYTQAQPLPGNDIIYADPFDDTYPNLDLLPAQLELDNTEIDLAGTTFRNAISSEWAKRTLLCKWLQTSGADNLYTHIIFDCPPATKLVSQNSIAASHYYVLPVIPDAVSSRGVTHFRSLVKDRIDSKLAALAAAVSANEIPSTYVPTTSFGGIVISMAKTHGPAASGYINEHTQHMEALRRRYGNDVLTNTIDFMAGFPESLSRGWPVFDQQWNPNVTNRHLDKMMMDVCGELIQRMP